MSEVQRLASRAKASRVPAMQLWASGKSLPVSLPGEPCSVHRQSNLQLLLPQLLQASQERGVPSLASVIQCSPCDASRQKRELASPTTAPMPNTYIIRASWCFQPIECRAPDQSEAQSPQAHSAKQRMQDRDSRSDFSAARQRADRPSRHQLLP